MGKWVCKCLWEVGNSPTPGLYLGLGWFLSFSVVCLFRKNWSSQFYKTWATSSPELSQSFCTHILWKRLFHTSSPRDEQVLPLLCALGRVAPSLSWHLLPVTLQTSLMSFHCPSSTQKSPSLLSCSLPGANTTPYKIILCFSAFFPCNVLFWAKGDWNCTQYSRYVWTMDSEFSLLVSNNPFYFFIHITFFYPNSSIT